MVNSILNNIIYNSANNSIYIRIIDKQKGACFTT